MTNESTVSLLISTNESAPLCLGGVEAGPAVEDEGTAAWLHIEAEIKYFRL